MLLWTCLGAIATAVSNVVQLQKLNFDHLVYGTTSTERWFVKFYAPWCTHCQRLQPIWEELASKDDQRIRYGEVDCTMQQDLCSSFDVSGYPTLVLIESKTRRFVPYTGARLKTSIDVFAGTTDFDTSVATRRLKNSKATDKSEAAGETQPAAHTVLPDEAELGPAVVVLEAADILDFGPGSRIVNFYIYGLTLVTCICLGIYFVAGSRQVEEKKAQ